MKQKKESREEINSMMVDFVVITEKSKDKEPKILLKRRG